MDDQTMIDLLHSLSPIVGIAPTPFPRVTMAGYLNDYSIVCFKFRREVPIIKGQVDVFCLEERYPDIRVPKVNAKEILSLSKVQDYLKSKPGVSLLLYKPSHAIEEMAVNYGWKIIGNRYEVKELYENKKNFREVLKACGVEPISGEVVKFDDLDIDLYHQLKVKYGEHLVFQIAEMTAGGGTGTAFINDDNEFDAFKEKFTIKREKLTAIEHVNVTRFITGIPSSIAGCITRYGVLSGRIQTQIQDIPDVRVLTEGSGLFCGHDWSFRQYPDKLQKQAKDIAKKFGEYIYKQGYRGIFGLDLLVDEKEEKVYPVECNPRFTDAFPVLSMMYQSKGLLPMDVFHVLEHLNVDYQYDIEGLSQKYDQPLEGAQIILETKTDKWTKAAGEVKAGIYRFEGKQIQFVRDGYSYVHLQSENEFLVTEGVPFVGTVYKPGARVLRLVFKKAILKEAKELTDEAKEIIRQIYALVDLQPTESQEYYPEES